MNDSQAKGLAESLDRIADSVCAPAAPGHDETGGTICSLTEAVMGITAGLCRVASAIESLATSVNMLEK